MNCVRMSCPRVRTLSFCSPAATWCLGEGLRPESRPPGVVWALSKLMHMRFLQWCLAHSRDPKTSVIMGEDEEVSIRELLGLSTHLSKKLNFSICLLNGPLSFNSFYSNITSVWYFLAKICKGKAVCSCQQNIKVLSQGVSVLFTKAPWVHGPLIQVSTNNHADVYTLLFLVL